ncbi:hypothetical protein [Sphingobium sp. SYK-6]|uniref:hypothetical protein n=1 Tax=Sphingobium sp. (strain NBRC 103272 / SYK-6) TaxID=627192 RepID=UPI0011D29522|nr:hypothetical protein [Sphingobium sp. SYK-6]
MTRVDDDMLSLHLEMALCSAVPSLLDSLTDSDGRRRHAAVGEIVRQLLERLHFFDIRAERDETGVSGQLLLFPPDMRPLG